MLVVSQAPEPAAQAVPPAECEANCAHHRPVRLSRAKLLKRVFELDMERCPNCGGELKIIVAILEQPVIEKVLSTAGGLTLTTHHGSGGPAPRAAWIGCARASQDRVNAAEQSGQSRDLSL